MPSKIKLAAIIIWVISTLFIIVGSLSTKVSLTEKYYTDKIVHGGAYAGLALLTFFFINNKKYRIIILLMLVLMGGGIEIAQKYLPPRSCTFGDFAADVIGILVGCLIAIKIKPLVLRLFNK